jgi:putative transposase
VELAFKAFFRSVQTGENPGYPRFKGKGRYDSLTYPQSGFGLDSGKLHLSKIGDIKIKFHRPIEGKIKTCTIRRMPTGKWFACLSVEVKVPYPAIVPAKSVNWRARLVQSSGRTYAHWAQLPH